MYLILMIIIILLIILKILNKKEENHENINNTSSKKNTDNYNTTTTNHDVSSLSNNSINNNSITNYKNYYKPKRYITTLNEMNFYKVLLEIAKELDYILFSQVSLYNIIKMKDNLDYSTHTKYFNKIASKSIDFVLVDKKCRIKLCIELDDNTHKKKSRIERDKFINKLFKDLEIDLLRYPVYNTYYKETLKRRILENIKEHYYED